MNATNRRRRGWAGASAALCLAAAWAAPALACPVCYGEASGGVIEGTRLSVAFLGGLLYLLLAGGAGMVFVVRRRALRQSDPRHGLRVIEGRDGDHPTGRPRPAGDQETSER